MTRLHGVIFVCATAGLGGAMAAAGCSSSSSPASASPTPEGGSEASVTVIPDGASPDGAQTSVTVQWKIVDISTTPADGGADASAAVDASDAGEADGQSDAGLPPGDAGDGAADDAPAVEADDASDAASAADGAMNLTDLPPLQGVAVCVYQNSAIPCVTSQADGTFSISGLPVRSDVVLSLKKDGYNSYLLPIETASTDTDERSNPVYMNKIYATPPAVGVAVDLASKGAINTFAVVVSGAAMNSFSATMGTSVSINPMTANGPFYLGNDGYVLDAGTFQGSTALFYNVDPGMYTLTYANDSYDCEPISFPFGGFGWPLTTPPHSLKVVVAAGYITGIVGELCTPNAKIVATDGG